MKKNKQVSVRKLKLSEINELSIAVFICKTSKETEVKNYIHDIGGIVLSSIRGKGLSREGIAVAFGAYAQMNVIFAMCQKEIGKTLVHDISLKFKLHESGNGKGFLIDTEGYMGAKAPFIE